MIESIITLCLVMWVIAAIVSTIAGIIVLSEAYPDNLEEAMPGICILVSGWALPISLVIAVCLCIVWGYKQVKD